MEDQKTKVAKYSHAFLVGSFNSNISPQDLDTNIWKSHILNSKDYSDLLSDYYQSLVDSMAEAEKQKRPEFLQSVCHYVNEIDPEGKQQFVISLTKGRDEIPYDYKISLCKLHLYFFPNEIVLMVMEIDDKGVDVNLMTLGHSSLINLKFAPTGNDELKEKMKPLLDICSGDGLKSLVKDGNNLKIYQIVEVEADAPADNLLFEIGTFIPEGAVGGKNGYSPSKTYFDSIIKENSISVFYNWKALALVDSFTVLGVDNYNKWTWENLYFPLIYLRCIFEKTFCFSRNSSYRLDKSIKNISQEITDMEKYYFYNNISYNFLPELLYDFMVKGIGLKEEREEISKQIKEQVKEKEDNRQQRITIYLGAFAIFSVAWDLCSMFMKGFTDQDATLPARLAFIFSIVAIIILIVYQTIYKDKWKKSK